MISNSQAIADMDKYIDGVLSGEIVSGELARQAVERHVRDLEREDFPYHFDRQAADIAIGAFPTLFRHTQGSFAGSPFVLSPFAAFGIGCIFGWRCADGTRRFRRAYWSTGRKTGKSMVAMGIAILLANYDGEEQAQVWLGATKRDQAKDIVFAECLRQCRQSPPLGKAKTRVLSIEFGESFIKPTGSDKPFDGLFPSGVIFDELHAWKEHHRPFYDTLTTGFGPRRQPLRFTITTAGDSKSFLWKEEVEHAKKVLNGTIAAEQYFVYIAQLDKEDDPLDIANYVKSIPNLGECTPASTIQDLIDEAEHSPQARNRLVRYFANREVSHIEQAIDPALWDACEGELSDWNQADAIAGGIDAGGRNDLGAGVVVARFLEGFDEDGEAFHRYECRLRCYLDMDSSREQTQEPWFSWIDRGLIEVTPTVFTRMRDNIAMDLQKWDGRQIGFDPWSMQATAEELQTEGFECVRIAQSRYNLHEPLTLLLDLIRKGLIRHDGHPLFRWAFENLVINADSNERWMPDRANSADKIDPVAALIMGLRLASLAPARPQGSAFIS